MPSSFAGSPVALAGHVSENNRKAILEGILSQVYAKSIIIKVIDISNFEGTQIDEIYKEVNRKKHKLILVVNKIDTLPEGFTVERV